MPISTGLLIVDSSPLIALAKLSLLDLPSRLFNRVVVPDVVYQECAPRYALSDAQAIKAAVATGVIEALADNHVAGLGIADATTFPPVIAHGA